MPDPARTRVSQISVSRPVIRPVLSQRICVGEFTDKAHKRLGGNHGRRESSIPTRYELCMIGVREEFKFCRTSFPNMLALSARLSRIREEIDRTIKEINAKHLVM